MSKDPKWPEVHAVIACDDEADMLAMADKVFALLDPLTEDPDVHAITVFIERREHIEN